MSTPSIQLQTLFILNAEGRIVSTREPGENNSCPVFSLIRSSGECVWAVRADVPDEVAIALSELARQEPTLQGLPSPNEPLTPHYAPQYLSLIAGKASSGPAFTFPESLPSLPLQSSAPFDEVVEVQDVKLLDRHFAGWSQEEIEGRSPMLAVLDKGHAVSICFCARRSDTAAEAGLETAEAYRGQGFGPKVTAAWSALIRASGRMPLYSTSWDNHASLAVTRKLGLSMYASDWSVQYLLT